MQARFAITTCAYFYSQHGSSLYKLTLGAVKHQLSLCRDCSPKASPCSPCLPIALPRANKSAKEDFLQWEARNSTKINRSCWRAQIQVVSLSGLQGRIWLCYWQRPSVSSRVENVVRSCKLSLFSSYSVAVLMCVIDRSDRYHILHFNLCHCCHWFPLTGLRWEYTDLKLDSSVANIRHALQH